MYYHLIKNRIKTIVLFAIILIGNNSVFGTTIASISTGNWSAKSTWSTNNVPDNGDDVIITGGFTVTLDRSAAPGSNSLNSLTINSGSIFSTTASYNVRSTTITLNGTYTNVSTGIIAGTMTVGATGIYQHNIDGGTIPTATWSAGSTCQIIGISTTTPSGLTQSFYHFTWNCSGQTTDILLSTNLTINGNLTVQNCGGNELQFADVTGNTCNVGGNLIVSSGVNFDLAVGTGIPVLNLSGNLNVSGTLLENSNGASVNFVGSATQTLTKTGAFSGILNFTVNSTSTLNLGTAILDGDGAFTLISGGTLIIGHASGITSSGATGNIQVSLSRTYSTGGNYNYNGTSSQVFGNGLPATVNNLTINNANTSMALTGSKTINGTLTLSSGRLSVGANTLTLNGNFSGSSSNCLIGSATSNLSIGNTGTIGTLYIDQTTIGTTNRLQNLTINRSSQTITLGNIFEVTGTVTLSNGTLASAGFLTLVSNTSVTARIGTITGSGAITGNVTIQRYIPGGNSYDRAYRFLASPSSGQTLANAWQQDIHITGPGTGGSVCPTMVQNSNGFDHNSSTISSIYTYSEVTGAWTSIPNSNVTTLSSTTAYRVFVRGSRTQGCGLLTTPYATAQNVTLKATGTVTTGTVNTSLTYTASKGAGWNFITNPYPSAIDWANSTWVAARSSNINSTIYIWNPAIGTAGAYASYNSAGGGSVNSGSNIIQSGQSFMVRTTAAATLTFQEAYKSTNQTTQLFGKTELSNNLKIQLKDTIITDEAVVFVNRLATHNIDNADGIKMSFGTGSVATFTSLNDTALTFNAVEQFMAPNTDTIFMKTGLVASKSYTLNFIGARSFSLNIHPYLYDTYTSTSTDLTVSPSYSFFTNTISGSISQTRFYLVFADPNSLPVVLNNFSAQKKDKSSSINWSTSSEINSSAFVIERINDAANFIEIANVKAAGHSIQNLNYSAIDAQPDLSGINYYRLKQIDADGKYTYSSIATVDFSSSANNQIDIKIWPNPVNDKINIGLNGKPNQLVTLEIFDLTGKKLSSFTIISNSNSEISKDISFLSSGVYLIKVKTETSESIKKFIK